MQMCFMLLLYLIGTVLQPNEGRTSHWISLALWLATLGLFIDFVWSWAAFDRLRWYGRTSVSLLAYAGFIWVLTAGPLELQLHRAYSSPPVVQAKITAENLSTIWVKPCAGYLLMVDLPPLPKQERIKKVRLSASFKVPVNDLRIDAAPADGTALGSPLENDPTRGCHFQSRQRTLPGHIQANFDASSNRITIVADPLDHWIFVTLLTESRQCHVCTDEPIRLAPAMTSGKLEYEYEQDGKIGTAEIDIEVVE